MFGLCMDSDVLGTRVCACTCDVFMGCNHVNIYENGKCIFVLSNVILALLRRDKSFDIGKYFSEVFVSHVSLKIFC